MRIKKLAHITTASLAIGALAACGNGDAETEGGDAGGEDFPNGNVRIVVGSGPGSTMDELARLLAPYLQEEWDESVVVDNVPGANQSAAYNEVANAEPDGHTLFIGVHGTMGIHNALGNLDTPYDEFEWFGTLVEEPYTFYTAADSDIETLDDLVDAEPVRYGDSGYESPVNPFALTVFDALDTEFIFTPGFDPGAAQSGVLTGEQHLVGRDAAQMLRGGTDQDFRALLVASEEPHPLQPDAATFTDVEEQFGVDMPVLDIFQLGFPIGTTPGTDEETVDMLADTVRGLIEENEEFQTQLEENYMEESMLAERIGRETTSEYVQNVIDQYEEFGVEDLQQQLEAGGQ
ncbi:tripartite tricarboxylate transporter substrate-binding protein [Nesterenkonia lutea]|uniref:Tripartite-type tricarboxylate transporter receptor subunit TctC n=1 Tax=Nesterenkonia lutea TaxID=272919 RepID=A0ABR9JEP1_9MICC|nr:tripartite tricarboxylate transporter substrate-binding protein [Nesterenkonia lutea]MBE1524399.1 tripartite-type tricarboxylate transporter receptor subunit TctC [Nesterenkonia lutea]